MKQIRMVGVFLAIFTLASTHCSKRPTGPIAGAGGGKSAPSAAAPAPSANTNARYLEFNNRAEPEFLDPGMMAGTYEASIAEALFEGLLEYNPKGGDLLPGVAERYEVSTDGLTYTFYLRKNAQWSNGESVTANDFVYAWRRVLDPKTASQYAFIMYILKNGAPYNQGKIADAAQVGVKALDDFTLQVLLEHPAPYFPSLAAFHSYRPVPKVTVEQYGSEWTKPEHMVSNGAFMLKEWTPHKDILTVKNPRYWDAANVKLAGVHFLPLDDLETALKMYESGSLDIDWELPAVKVPSLMARPDFVKAPFNANEYLRLNTTKPPFDNPKVRKAFAMAIDRKTLVEQYLQNTEVAWQSFTPSGLPGYSPPAGVPFDPAGAKRLLAEAGYPDPGALSVQYLYNTKDANKLVAQVLQQMWQQNLGVKVEPVNEEWKTYVKDMQALNFQMLRSGWVGDYLDPMTYMELMTGDSTSNCTGWKNPQFDALVHQAMHESDAAKRNQEMQQAEMILLEQAPVIPLFAKSKSMLVKPNVRGFYPNLTDIHPFKFVWLDDAAPPAAQ